MLGTKNEDDRMDLPEQRRWKRLEATSLFVLVVIAVAIWGFLELADYAREGNTAELDRSLLLALRTEGDPSDPIGPPWFEVFVRDITALGGLGPLAIFTTAVVGYLVLSGRRKAAVLLAVSILGGAMLSFGLKELFGRVRPDVVPHLTRVSTASFPSGHAVLSTVVYVTLGSMLAPAQRGRLRVYVIAVAFMLASLVGVSRVYLGVHWPSDVAAGFAVGSAWAGMTWLIDRRLQKSTPTGPDPSEPTYPSGESS